MEMIIPEALIGGVFATAILTISQKIDKTLSNRAPSLTPLKALVSTIGFKTTEISKNRRRALNDLVHWGYGILWAFILINIAVNLEISNFVPLLFFYFVIIWGQNLIVPALLGASSPFWKWSLSDIAKSFTFHFIYALALSLFHIY